MSCCPRDSLLETVGWRYNKQTTANLVSFPPDHRVEHLRRFRCGEVEAISEEPEVVRGDKHDEVRSFLQSFPNLEELILGTESGGQISEQRIALRSLQWPNLRRVHFRHLWTSEDELMDFIGRHPIQQIALRNITLFSGSWESFRRRIQAMLTRPLHSVTCITVGGIEIAFDKAVTSHPGWPGSVCALKPRVYLLLSRYNGKQEQKFWRVAYNGKKTSVLFPY